MYLKIAASSHPGKVRVKNEDNLYFLGHHLPEQNAGLEPVSSTAKLNKPVLLGVFDGMGGYAAGEKASCLMAKLVSEACAAAPRDMVPRAFMLALCEKANLGVCRLMYDNDGTRMGTTASMLCLGKKTYTLCNIGDSPIFLLRSGVLTEISMEHTERSIYESITGKKADPKRKFRLTQNIGMFPDEIAIEPYCAEGKLQKGDVFLLCSDGITDMVERDEITQILVCRTDPQKAVEELTRRALENGGKDNATAICLRVCGGWRFGRSK